MLIVFGVGRGGADGAQRRRQRLLPRHQHRMGAGGDARHLHRGRRVGRATSIPAVTIALAVRRGFPWSKVPIYALPRSPARSSRPRWCSLTYHEALAAFDGGMRQVQGDLGTAGIFATYPQPFLSTGGRSRRSDRRYGAADGRRAGADRPAQRGPPAWLAAPLIGGLVVAIGVAFGFNAGYAINPARDFGPRLFTAVAGWGGARVHGRRRLVVGADRRPVHRRGGRGGALRRVRRALPAGGGAQREPLHPCSRSGHDVEPQHRLRSRRARGGAGPAGVSADLSRPRPGRARPGGHLVLAAPDGARRPDRARGSPPPTSRRSASPISARPPSCGRRPPASRSPTRSCGRAASPRRFATGLKAEGHEATFRRKTGLVLDAYFSGTKIKHLLDSFDGLRARAATRRDAVRHRRHVPDLAADRRHAVTSPT